MSDEERKKSRPCSGVPQITEIPRFGSAIPPELTAQLDRKYQALFRAISAMERMDEWSGNHVLQHNRAIHKICDELESLQLQLDEIVLQRKIVSAKWQLFIVIGTVAGTVLLTKLVETLFTHMWP